MPEPEYHSLQCPNCHGSVVLAFEQSTKCVKGISIELIDCPTLRCPDCGYSTLPSVIQSSLNETAKKASGQGETRCRITFKNNRARFSFCEKVEFLYDYRDYLYLPGLFRGWNDGFLTPVFFRAHVLHKYRNSPGYRVDMASDSYGTVYFPDGEYLSFGVNRRGEIIAWLGDIDQLPLNEQYYLRSENIESSHDIASEFYDGQIDVIFTEPSKEQQVFAARAQFIRGANALTGLNTSSLDEEAATLLEHFSPPLDEGRRTLLDTLHDLHKVCVETISREAFAQDLTRRGISFDQKFGSLKILQRWIEKVLESNDASDIVRPLFVLDDLRKLEAHLVGSSSANMILESACKRLNIDVDSDTRTIYDKLILELGRMYEQLARAVSQLA